MPQAPAPAVLGLDPGSRCTGYAVVASGAGGRINLHRAGAITAPRGAPVPQRLGYIFSELARIIAELEPAEMAVEGVFTAKNSRTALVLGQARGVAILAGVQAGLSYPRVPPGHGEKVPGGQRPGDQGAGAGHGPAPGRHQARAKTCPWTPRTPWPWP